MSKFAERRYYITFFMGAFFLFYGYRLFVLQLVNRDFKAMAESTGIEREVIYPSRGLIYDRNQELLVFNQFQNDIYFTYNDVDPDMDRLLFCDILDISIQEFEERIEKDWSSPRYSKNVSTIFMRKVHDTVATSLRENQFRFPGFNIKLRTARGYNYETAPHLLGYISEVNQTILDTSDVYSKGEYIGVSGLERQYEHELRGTNGKAHMLKDNMGRATASYKNGALDVPANEGIDLHLGIDVVLQQFGETLLGNKKGAIVAIEPKTGEILAMVSAPSYEPSKLAVSQERGEIYAALATDSLKPLFDRSRMADYPPGSLFKPILALIAMQEGILSPERKISCHGAYYYKSFSWNCHSHSTSSVTFQNVRRAISESCNTFFFTLYREFIDQFGFDQPEQGLDLLVEYLDRMGVGRKLGIDLPSESAGHDPDVEFYNNLYKEDDWRSTYIISNGIGQGEVELTTLQMANLAAMLANRGYYYVPHLLKRFGDGQHELPSRYTEKQEVGINPTYFNSVIDGMQGAIEYGTARAAYIPGITLCGKTGTSENPHGADHSVFFGFAPRDKPEIAIAVYVENAGFGGTYGAPIGSLMCEKYLADSISPNRQWLLNHVLSADLIH